MMRGVSRIKVPVRTPWGCRGGVGVLPQRWLASSVGAYVPLPQTLETGSTIRYPHPGRAHVLPLGSQGREREQQGTREFFTVAVVGASGAMGRQIAMSLAARRREFFGLGRMALQLVGSRDDNSLGTLMGLCSELRDGYDESCPDLEVMLDLEAVQADIIVMAAGATLSNNFRTHTELARANADIFAQHASKLFQANRRSLVIIVSNPTEFGVDTFVNAGYDPKQVLGAGSFLDSLRFRREIASELGVSRQHVSGLVLGVNGLSMVPCWSTVRLAAFKSAEKQEHLERLKEEGLARMPIDTESLRVLAYEVRDLAIAGDALAANAIVNKQPPDARAALRRYLTFFAGPNYPRVGSAQAVVRIIKEITDGGQVISAAQIHMDGTFLGISGHALGAPVIVSSRGVEIDLRTSDLLTAKEIEAIRSVSEEAKSLHRSAEAAAMFKEIKRRAAATKAPSSGASH